MVEWKQRRIHVHHALTAGVAAFCALLSGCGGGDNGPLPIATRVVYIETNATAANTNAVVAYRQDSNGRLTLINSYSTGGNGTKDPSLSPSGVLDTDKSVIINSARRQLFAVNQGSDTIAVFKINSDGTLTVVPGSPFPSGGHAPVSLGLSNNDTVLTVVNSSLDPARNTSDIAPNYTSFKVATNGALTPIANSTISLPAGGGPSIALPANGGSLLFGTNFLTSQLTAYQVSSTGVLAQAAGSPHTSDASIFTGAAAGKPTNVLGVGVHPNASLHLVYFNFPLAGLLGVYSYDSSGTLTLVRAVPNSGGAACWIVINNAGTRLYTSNALSGDISVFDIGTDPTTPTQIQKLSVTSTVGSQTLTGNPWQLSLDPSNQFLYVLTPRDLGNTPAGQGNTIQVLQVAADGTLSLVSNSTVTISVPLDDSPQGIAVL